MNYIFVFHSNIADKYIYDQCTILGNSTYVKSMCGEIFENHADKLSSFKNEFHANFLHLMDILS